MSFCIQIPVNGSGRRIVIGDVHGCCKTLVHLIEEDITLDKEDQLFLLGDLCAFDLDSFRLFRTPNLDMV